MLLNPKGFAVIGASSEKEKVGHIVFKNLLKSKIKAYPVNPNTSKVLRRKCYDSVIELKNKVTHAVIAVPAKIVPQVVEECGAAGVKTLIVISAGFSEVGNNKLEEEVKELVKNHDMRLLGPNVLGVIVPGVFNASFFEGEIKSGGVSFISQSGALGVGVLDSLINSERGLRSFISVGNAADINITEALKEALSDKKTSCVIIYAESLQKGKEFMEACSESDKPVFILKAGTSSAGKRAASTHTGSLAGSDEVYSAAFNQCGAKRVGSLKSLINAGMTYDQQGFLGENALIITNAGGPGILVTDALEKAGIKVPKLPSKLVRLLNKRLKGVAWSGNNPVDVVGDARADRYSKVFKTVSKHSFYNEVIVLLTPQAMTEPLKTAKELVTFSNRIKKPLMACFIGGPSIKEAVDYLAKKGVTVFQDLSDLTSVFRFLV